MACNLCRERKVRCDVCHLSYMVESNSDHGQSAQPICSRCRRLGDQCVYNIDRRLSNRDNERRLNEAISTLKERLCTSSDCSDVLQD